LHSLVGSIDNWEPLALYGALDILATGYAFARFDNQPPDFADMTPAGWPGASGFMANLNGNINLELVQQRAGVRYAIGQVETEGGYYGGPFRLVSSAAVADAAGFAIMLYGFYLQGTALDILGALTWDDPYYFDHQLGAYAAYALGDDIEYLPYFWHNDLIGGIPNDALIYLGAQGIPGFTSEETIVGLAHTEQTGNSASVVPVRNRLLIISSQ
jgi:hypothetical protein